MLLSFDTVIENEPGGADVSSCRERSRLQRLKSKCVREHPVNVCVNEGGARQTATSPPSHSVVCWCLVSEEEGNSPSARLLKQLEARQKLQGCEDACSLCKEKKKG